jgi:predicted Ser/Thr protein kinase
VTIDEPEAERIANLIMAHATEDGAGGHWIDSDKIREVLEGEDWPDDAIEELISSVQHDSLTRPEMN